MKVSIVTISFNQAQFLERAMRSVLTQDYPDVEYIVVDPGSTDGSRALIAAQGSRIKAILDKDNGPADGLNKGFAAATGDIFGFLNADDILYPGAIYAVVRFLSSHPQVDVVSGNANVIGPCDEILRRVYSDRMSARAYLYNGAILIQPSTYFRRSAFERVGGFNVNNNATWDGELFFRMASAGCNFARLNAILSAYRLHAESITVSMRTSQKLADVRQRLFRDTMGREANPLDAAISKAYWLKRKIFNPRDTLERMFHGRVFGRKV